MPLEDGQAVRLSDRECISIMRELSDASISSLIYDDIIRSNDLYFLNVVNIRKLAPGHKRNILVSPNFRDKAILSIVASKLTSILVDDMIVLTPLIEAYFKNLIQFYDKDDIDFHKILTHEENMDCYEDLHFYDNYKIVELSEKLRKYGPNADVDTEDLYFFKMQMFIYASIWFDMDKYLLYLYHKYA